MPDTKDIDISNSSGFSPATTSASPNTTTVKFRAQGGPLRVYTFTQNASGYWQQTNVFNGNDQSPYEATTAGKPYTVKTEMKNKAILLSLLQAPSGEALDPRTPTNGTINVGGGPGNEPPGDGEKPPGGGAEPPR